MLQSHLKSESLIELEMMPEGAPVQRVTSGKADIVSLITESHFILQVLINIRK